MAPPGKHLHAIFKMPHVDPTVIRQLRNLPSRHNATPSPPIQQSTCHGICDNSAPTSLAPDLDDDKSLAAYQIQEIHK